jgi:hypothetical protein
MRNFIICTLHQILSDQVKKMRGAEHAARMGEIRMHTFWFENLKGRDHLEDISIDGSTMLDWILENQSWNVLGGFTWLRIEASGELL